MKSLIFCILHLLFVQYVAAQTVFPTGLNQNERKLFLSTMGFGTAPKIISNPYPLGGYTGWEVGLSSEFLSLESISGLGSAPSGEIRSKGDFTFYSVTLSKGIFENIDTSVSFLPTLQGESITGFGVSARWTFYESPYSPLSLATHVYGGGVNLQSKVGMNTIGADILCVMAMEDLGLYFGLGQAKVFGEFVGGSGGWSADQARHSESVSSSHSLFGVSFQVSKLLLAFEVDRFKEPIYGARVGLRY